VRNLVFIKSLCIIVQTDPIQSLLRHFDGEVAASNRQTLNADSVTQDDKGIQELIEVSIFFKEGTRHFNEYVSEQDLE
jgi:hypothetical protein